VLKRGKRKQQEEKEQEKVRNKGDDSQKIDKGFVLMNARFWESTGF
jgi:hypothetical protein